INISGTGSQLQTGAFTIGNSGIGNLNITAGGTATNSGNALIGANAKSTGSATVSGPGSTWTIGGLLSVCEALTVSLIISIGGTVNVPVSTTVIGDIPMSTGNLTVTGQGSTLNTNGLNVGSSGTGSLNVNSGATVSTFSTAIAAFS